MPFLPALTISWGGPRLIRQQQHAAGSQIEIIGVQCALIGGREVVQDRAAGADLDEASRRNHYRRCSRRKSRCRS